MHKGKAISRDEAVARRKKGEDVVVCGSELAQTRRLALDIESAVGPCKRHKPHDAHAGPAALPHYQQQDGSFPGHTFYETPKRKARKKR